MAKHETLVEGSGRTTFHEELEDDGSLRRLLGIGEEAVEGIVVEAEIDGHQHCCRRIVLRQRCGDSLVLVLPEHD